MVDRLATPTNEMGRLITGQWPGRETMSSWPASPARLEWGDKSAMKLAGRVAMGQSGWWGPTGMGTAVGRGCRMLAGWPCPLLECGGEGNQGQGQPGVEAAGNQGGRANREWDQMWGRAIGMGD